MQQHVSPNEGYAHAGYDNNDLSMFKAVLEEAVAELRMERSPLASPDQIELTRWRLASGIFLFADRGEREPTELKRLAKSLLHGIVQAPKLRSIRGGKAGVP